MEYEEMLTRGRAKLPESVFEKARFEIPKVLGHIQGNKTVISNFHQIAQAFRREEAHLLKFIQKELATPGEIKRSGGVIFGTKLPAARINEKIKKYAETFVLCRECGKPDTKIIRDGEFSFIKCTACGSKHPVSIRI